MPQFCNWTSVNATATGITGSTGIIQSFCPLWHVVSHDYGTILSTWGQQLA